MQIDYSTLQADVAAWQEKYLAHVMDAFGEEAAIASDADLNADPSLALMWYMEDLRRGLPQVNHAEDAEATDPIEITAGEDFNPVFHEVEMDGETVVIGNADAIIEMLTTTTSPETAIILGAYRDAHAELTAANEGALDGPIREQALLMALERSGIELDMSGADQAQGTLQ